MGVRIGDKDRTAGADVVRRVDPEFLIEGDLTIGHAVHIREHRIESVGDVREDGRLLTAAVGHEGEVEHFVRAVGDDHVLPCEGRRSCAPGGQHLRQLF